MNGCANTYSKSMCEGNERSRMEMNLEQPARMKNYTELGFAKTMCPPEVFKKLKEWYHKYSDSPKPEKWPAGNTYTNHWASPTLMVSLEERKFKGGLALKDEIWNATMTYLEDWSGQVLSPTSLYGVRIYTGGSVLAPHVDRNPLVTSVIINVNQDIDEPWPLEVYSHDGLAYNVTMKEGDMVLYESHSVIHGRPFPLKGREFANVFVHFEPADKGYETGKKSRAPPPPPPSSKRQKALHKAAAMGNLDAVIDLVKKNPPDVNAKDHNDWTPLHEAGRAGHLDVLEYLHENGGDINLRTNGGKGDTVYGWVKKLGGNEHVAEWLVSHGGEL